MNRTQRIGGCRIAFLLPLLSLCATPSCGGNDPAGPGNLASQAMELCSSMEAEGIRYGKEWVNAVKAEEGFGLAVCHYLPSGARDADWHYLYAAFQFEPKQEHQTLESMEKECRSQGLKLSDSVDMLWLTPGRPVEDHPVAWEFFNEMWSDERQQDLFWGIYRDDVLCTWRGGDRTYSPLGEIPCNYWCTTGGDWRSLGTLPELKSAK